MDRIGNARVNAYDNGWRHGRSRSWWSWGRWSGAAAVAAVLVGAAAGGGGFGGPGGGSGRYNLTFSSEFQQLLNHTNLNNPVGNLGSSLFGQSTSTAGGFGGFGGGDPAYNRRIDAQIRFSF